MNKIIEEFATQEFSIDKVRYCFTNTFVSSPTLFKVKLMCGGDYEHIVIHESYSKVTGVPLAYDETVKIKPIKSAEDLSDWLKSCMAKLNSLQYSKLHGCFLLPGKRKFEEIMAEMPGQVEDCSVCIEPTMTRTRCGHCLCRVCWMQLKTLVCPICRVGIKSAKI